MGKRKPATDTIQTTPALMGRPTRYRGKDRSNPVFMALTSEARAHLTEQATRLGLSKPDYVEGLIRGDIKAVSL